MQYKYITDLKNILISDQHRNVSLHFAARTLAENILKAETNHQSEMLSFYELFVDILFLNANSENDRLGLSNVFEGLNEILEAASDYANLPIESRDELASALKNFQSSLRKFESRRGAENEFLGFPEKQLNAVSYLLSNSRKAFLLTEFFPLMLVREYRSTAFFYQTVKKLCDQLEEEKNLIYAEPLAQQLVDLLKKDSANQSQKSLSCKTIDIYHQLKDKIELRWCRLCLVAYRATRIAIETPAPNADKLFSRSQKTSLAVKIALGYVPTEVVEKEDVIIQLSSGAVSDAMRRCYASKKYHLSTVDGVSRIAWFLLQGEKYIWNTRWRRQYSNELKNKSEDRENFDSKVHKKSSGAVESLPAELLEKETAWMDEVSFQIEEGGSPDELYDISSPTIEDSPKGTSAESQPFRLLFDQPTWGRGNLTSETIGTVWSWLVKETQLKPQDSAVQHLLVFAELLIYHGFQVSNLLKAKFSLNPSFNAENEAIQISQQALYLAPKRGTQAAAFASPLTALKDYYLPSQTGFEFSFAQKILERVQKIEKASLKTDGMLYFAELKKKNQLPKEIGKNFNKLLKPLEEILGEKITIEKIARSIRALFREQGKLSNLETAILSTEVPHRIISPSFYTNVLIENLTSRFQEAIAVNIENIINASQDYIRHLKLPELTNNDKPIKYYCTENKDLFSDGIEDIGFSDQTNNSASKSEDLRLGSPFVPRIEKYDAYLNELKTLSRQSTNFILDHNRRTAVAVLSLMTLTGLRPLEISAIEKKHFTQTGNIPSLTVIAKLNQKHAEWRQLPLSLTAAEILREYIEFSAKSISNPELTSRLFQPAIRERIGQNVFYYFRKNYVPVALSTKSLYQLLNQGSYLEYEKFLWKLNSPRHLYRTTANEMRVPEKIINRLMGHQTTGLEAIGQFSADDYNLAADYVQLISEKICEVLNYEA